MTAWFSSGYRPDIEMSSSSDEDGSVGHTNENAEGFSGSSTVPLLQYSSVILPATRITPAFLEQHQAVCTACRTRVSHLSTRRVRVHPTLCTIVCRKCEENLIAVFGSVAGVGGSRCQWCVTSIVTERGAAADSAASAEQVGARCNDPQCGQFVCRPCLRQNLTREQHGAVRVLQEKGEWKCFRCNPQSLRPHQLYAATVAEYVRVRRRPVLLASPATQEGAVSRDSTVNSAASSTPAYSRGQREIERLASSARSLVEACALYTVSPDGQSSLIRKLEDHILCAGDFLDLQPNRNRPLKTEMTSGGPTIPEVPTCNGVPPLDYDDKSLLLDAIRQQNEPRQQVQPSERLRSRESGGVAVEGPTNTSRPGGDNSADRVDVARTSLGTVPANSRGMLDVSASAETERLAVPTNVKKERDSAVNLCDGVGPPPSKVVENTSEKEAPSKIVCPPVNTIDPDDDSLDSNATVDLPVVPNKKFSKQRLSNSPAEMGNRRGKPDSENEDDIEYQSLLASIEQRKVVRHQAEQQAGASGVGAGSDVQRLKDGNVNANKEKPDIRQRCSPFASSDDDAGDADGLNSSQPSNLGPIIVPSDCEGLSDLISEEDTDEDDNGDVIIHSEKDQNQNDDEQVSPTADSHNRRSRLGSENDTRDEQNDDVMPIVDEGRAQDNQRDGSNAGGNDSLGNDGADGEKKQKRLLKRSIPRVPVADAQASDSDDDEPIGGSSRSVKRKGRLSAANKLLDTSSESESSGERKRPRISSENELGLSPSRSTGSTTAKETKRKHACKDNASGGGGPSSSVAASKTKVPQDVLIVTDSDDDDDVIVPTRDKVIGHGKQKKIDSFMSTAKTFSKQAIKVEAFDHCVISSDDDESTQRLSSSSGNNRVQPKEEVTTPPSGTPSGRRNIREMMGDGQLSRSTREANAAERERRQRIEELQKKYNHFERCFGQAAGSDAGKCVLEYDLKTKEPLIEVHPSLARRLKAHQSEGIKFLYHNIIETASRLNDKEAGTGAILGHCMGLGKTFQVICLMHTLLTHPLLKDHFKTFLVVCPLNVVNAWRCEIDQWIKRDNTIKDKFMLYNLHNEKDPMLRESLMSKWTRSGGVLLVTPSLLTSLLGAETEAGQRKRQRREKSKQDTSPRVKPNAATTKKLKGFLCDPGASVVVVDEGHTLKNSESQVTQVVKMMGTSRKILLTGTPLQNNLTEYYTMVSLVSPNLLGTRQEFKNRFENPIANGQYKNSTVEDIRKMRRRASVLNQLLNNVVQRRDMSVLASILPPRQDYVLTVRLSPLQERLYAEFLGMLIKRAEDQAGASGPTFRRLLQDFVLLRSTWTHPKLLTMPKKTYSKKQMVVTVADMLTFDSITPEQDAQVTQKDWYKPHLEGKDLDDIALGPKLFILFDIIQQCALIEDKLVVFCTQLSALDLIEYLLRLMHENRIGKHCWIKDIDFFRMDGSTSAEDRQRFFGMFNDPARPRARLFLVSTNAGKLGSTLIGANRMVLLDTSWNPSDDNQAVYRIYRIGQVKPVYIYRFVSLGTMEEKIYARNILKESTGHRVLDDSNMERHFTHEDVRDLYTFTRYEDSDKVVPHVPKDRLLAELILRHKDNIAKVHEHQQMLQNLEDDLSEEDRRLAWEEYEKEKDAPPAQQGPQGGSGGPEISRAPTLLLVAEQLLVQVAQYSAAFRSADATEENKRDLVGYYLKKTKQALDTYDEVSKIDHRTLTECIRLQHPPEVTNLIVNRMQIINSKKELLRGELRKINEFITRAQQTPIRRMV